MKGYPQSLTRLVEELAKLPGIGEKSALRVALHLLRVPLEEAMPLARAIRDLKQNVRSCSVCFNLSDTDPCPICADAGRDRSAICVVEEPKDLIAVETAGGYTGVYHVLMGRLAPLDGVGPENLTIGSLVKRVEAGGVNEVILATNPTLEGDGTALCVQEQLSSLGVTVSRLARGLPAGATLEYAQPAVVTQALTDRRRM